MFYKIIDNDNPPPGVSKEQIFSAEEFALIPKDINLEEEIEKYKNAPNFPQKIDVCLHQIFVNERLGSQWENGVTNFEIYLPTKFIPDTSALYINCELVFALNNQTGEHLLNRVSDCDFETSMLKKNEKARQQMANCS